MTKQYSHFITDDVMLKNAAASQCLAYKDLFEPQELEVFRNRCPKHRKRIYTPDSTIVSFVSQVVSGNSSCKDVVENALIDRIMAGAKPCSLNTSSYVRARQRLPLEPIKDLTKSVAQTLDRDSSKEWLWKNRRVRVLDGSTLSMSDTKENQAQFPQNTNQRPGHGFPLARFVLITSLATGAVLDYAMGPFSGKKSSELFLAKGLLKTLDPGDVLVADAYYCGFAFMSLVRNHGLDFLSIRKGNAKLQEISSQTVGYGDRIIRIKKPPRKEDRFTWISEREYEKLPDTIQLRETTVTVSRNGFRTTRLVLISTLCNTDQYSTKEIADLFFRRWSIETDLKIIKHAMGMDFIKSKTPEMALKDCWVRLLAYNLLRRFMNKVAKRHQVMPRQLSFQQVQTFACSMYQRVRSDMDRYYFNEMNLRHLKQAVIKPRPHRFEPRAVKCKRGANSYPVFEMTRIRWKTLQIWPFLEMNFSGPLTHEIEKLIGFYDLESSTSYKAQIRRRNKDLS